MANTKGTSVISTPQGGGAVSGLGEKFSPDLFTGTGNFSVPIAVPPGRNGMQPELVLQYSSGSSQDVFGTGWNIGLPGVTRKTSKGIPVYNDKTDVFILTSPEDLVPVKITEEVESGITHQKTYYRPRTEGLFARIIRHKKSTGEHYWEVRSKDGMVSWYGTPGEPAENDTCVIADPEDRDKIFAWYMSKSEDPFGNEMVYTYERDLVLSNDRNYDNLYLKEINYCQVPGTTPFYLCKVVFNYEERPDPFSGYKQGFEVRTTKRCTSIETWTNAGTLIKTKTYHFDYADSIAPAEVPLNGMSLLKQMRVEGHNGDESEYMPPLTFNYSIFDPQKRNILEMKGPLPGVSLADGGFELVDVDGNGIPDILQMDGVTARRWPNRGNGEFGTPLPIDVAPSLNLRDPGVQLLDADGDGKTDLFVNNGQVAGFFSGSVNTVWERKRFKPYPKVPSFSFADPEVKLMDLDGDGITDVLRNGAGSFECFFNDPQKGFYKTRFTNKKLGPLQNGLEGGFPDFSFANPRVRFADMTGDGLEDIVYINSGRVEYWPNLGYGRFGKRIVMKNAPRFPDEFNPAQILLGDLDGDGMADIAFVENNRVTLYVNQSGNRFTDGHIIKGTPRVLNTDALRITDILGAGQSGILWSYGAGENIHGQMFFLDFTGGNKAYLLQEMNNNMGSLTRVKYGSSVYHYLRDQKSPATRWKTSLPFPVLVVNTVEMHDLLSGGKLATEYLYHHGYWDGEEREFRGFARVDQKDTETFTRFNTDTLFTDESFNTVSSEFYTPPTETRNWFYPGPVGEGYGQWISPDFSNEYWTGDAPMFAQPQSVLLSLSSIPRRAKRDALRTLRGTLLRSELYALDNTPLQTKPYTVTETEMGVRQEFDPSQSPNPAWIEEHGFETGGGYVFFPFNKAQRTSQYERGSDPMHSFSFTEEFDGYGQPQIQLSVGVPRGIDPRSGGNYPLPADSQENNPTDYLGVIGKTEFIYVDEPDQYMVTRSKRSLSYDATVSAISLSVLDFKTNTLSNYNSLPLIGCTITYYDGDDTEAFEGLPYGEIGEYGVAVRTESLVLTQSIVDAAYGSTPPELDPTPGWGTEYPTDFTDWYEDFCAVGGYNYQTSGNQYPITGWYAPGNRMKFDFHTGLPDDEKLGLLLETKDPFDNVSSITYDDYFLLPIEATDPLGLTMQAEYDYRVMQAYQITDPNENISVFDFSPLGLLRAVALIGKGTQGDYKGDPGGYYDEYAPSKILEYDFFAFVNNNDPVWVQTTLKEVHYQDDPEDTKTIISRQYSDGFGRLLQTRNQAEDVIFGNAMFGSSGLPASQTATNGPAVGVERDPEDPLNVTVSGWQVYNNKGAVVEKYEPFFDSGFDYVQPGLNGVKIKMFYDPRGQVIRTVNPDHSEQRVIFGIPLALDTPQTFIPTPWENYLYDPNDLAEITNPTGSNVNPDHYFTPASSLIDGLGRTIRAINHHSFYNGSSWEDVVVRNIYDIRGNVLRVIDPLNRTMVESMYDLGNNVLKSTHIDAGEKTTITDCAGRLIESRDAKGALGLNSYDEGSRPTHMWARDISSETVTLRQYIAYGDNTAVDPEEDNLNGKVYEHYDEAGYTKFPEYDFKGNLLTSLKQFISDAELLAIFTPPPTNWDVQCYRVDWTNFPDILDAREFETNSEYDALNRVTQVTYPEDTDSERKIGIPTYNRAGALQSMEFDGTNYVNHIAYNAKGQRLLIAYGNTQMTRYTYDNLTFRLKRLRTEKYNQTDFTFDPDGNPRQDYAYIYDLVGNIFRTNYNTPECGIAADDTLERNFEYDPLYRLLLATGRENYPGVPFPWWDDNTRSETAGDTTAYTQNYEYDKVGNITELAHTADSSPESFTREFNYGSSQNKLNSITVGSDTYTYSYDSVGNQITENTNRHFEWDHSNNMRCFFNQAGTSEPTIYALYLYDATGNRVKKLTRTSGGGYESTCYIGGAYEYKTDGTDEQNTLHVMDGSSRIAMVRTGDAMGDSTPAIKYNLEDNLSSSMMLLTDNGTVVNIEEYYPFGETSFGSYAKKRYKYQGKERDEESGLYYFGARYYCCAACRFTSVDPQLHPEQSSYCGMDNNPINRTDPTGMGTEDPPSKQVQTPNGTTVTVGDNISFSPDMMTAYVDGKVVAVWGGDDIGYIKPEYKDAPSFEQWRSDLMQNFPNPQTNVITGVDVWKTYQMSPEGKFITDFIVNPTINTADFLVTAPQYIRHALQQGLFNTPESKQQVWTIMNGWMQQGSPELESYNTEIQTQVVTEIIVGGVTAGIGELASPFISRLLTKAIDKGLDWAKISGIIKDAAKGKGNFGLGSGTMDEALIAGEAWVGEGYTVTNNGKIWISSDGLRQFRLPSYKPKQGFEQANFEWRNVAKGQWQGNGHLDILK